MTMQQRDLVDVSSSSRDSAPAAAATGLLPHPSVMQENWAASDGVELEAWVATIFAPGLT